MHNKKLVSFYAQKNSTVSLLTTAADLEPPELAGSGSGSVESQVPELESTSSAEESSVETNNQHLSEVDAILNEFIECTRPTQLSQPITELPSWLMTVLDDFKMWMQGPQGRLNRKETCLLYTSPSPRDKRQSRMPSSA